MIDRKIKIDRKFMKYFWFGYLRNGKQYKIIQNIDKDSIHEYKCS